MGKFALNLRLRVFEVLRALKRAERERILRWMERLERDPFQDGEFTELDDTGRKLQVAIVGKHALYFWFDGPVNQVNVVDMRLADRG